MAASSPAETLKTNGSYLEDACKHHELVAPVEGEEAEEELLEFSREGAEVLLLKLLLLDGGLTLRGWARTVPHGAWAGEGGREGGREGRREGRKEGRREGGMCYVSKQVGRQVGRQAGR